MRGFEFLTELQPDHRQHRRHLRQHRCVQERQRAHVAQQAAVILRPVHLVRRGERGRLREHEQAQNGYQQAQFRLVAAKGQ